MAMVGCDDMASPLRVRVRVFRVQAVAVSAACSVATSGSSSSESLPCGSSSAATMPTAYVSASPMKMGASTPEYSSATWACTAADAAETACGVRVDASSDAG